MTAENNIRDKILNMADEVDVTTGGYFSIYYAKSRGNWVVRYSQADQVEHSDLSAALDMALTELISERRALSPYKFSLHHD